MASSFTAPILPTAAPAHGSGRGRGRGRGSGGRGSGGSGSGGSGFTAPILPAPAPILPAPATAPSVTTFVPTTPFVPRPIVASAPTFVNNDHKNFVDGMDSLYKSGFTAANLKNLLSKCGFAAPTYQFEALCQVTQFHTFKTNAFLMKRILPNIVYQLRLQGGPAAIFFLACANFKASYIFPWDPASLLELNDAAAMTGFANNVGTRNYIGRMIDLVRDDPALITFTSRGIPTKNSVNKINWDDIGKTNDLCTAIWNNICS